MENYSVYRHIAPNGKMYVGITKVKPKYRWKNGNGYRRQPYFFNAIEKYGWENFHHEVLLDGLTVKQAELAERLFIGYWDLTNHKYGYNIESGGNSGYIASADTRHKRSMAMKGKHSGKNNPMYGRHLTKEQKQKISIANTGHVHSLETRKKMSRNRPKKTVLQLDKNTKQIISTFASTHDAHRQTGVCQSNIWACCNNKVKTAGGYCWIYDDKQCNIEGGA